MSSVYVDCCCCGDRRVWMNMEKAERRGRAKKRSKKEWEKGETQNHFQKTHKKTKGTTHFGCLTFPPFFPSQTRKHTQTPQKHTECFQ